MAYCKHCGCYIPVDAKRCLACGGYEDTPTGKSNEYQVDSNELSKAMDQRQTRINEMQKEFQRHKQEAERRRKTE